VGVKATPTLFINGQEMDGAMPASEVRAALDRALREAGIPMPAQPAASAAAGEARPSGNSPSGVLRQ
jgi:hypothetical protein